MAKSKILKSPDPQPNPPLVEFTITAREFQLLRREILPNQLGEGRR